MVRIQVSNASGRAARASGHGACPGTRTPASVRTRIRRWCRILSYLDSATSHGSTVLEAITAGLAGKPWLPRPRYQQTFVPLPELAVPYAAALCEHLQVEDRQSTAPQSRFLDACRSRNRGDLEAAQLAEATVRLGFANVIDAFHVSRGGQPTQTRFFVDERASRHGITLTDHLLELANGQQAKVLPLEVDARWNLVQLSWGLRLGTPLVSFEMPRMKTPSTCTRPPGCAAAPSPVSGPR